MSLSSSVGTRHSCEVSASAVAICVLRLYATALHTSLAGRSQVAHIGTYALAEKVDEGAHIAGYALAEIGGR